MSAMHRPAAFLVAFLASLASFGSTEKVKALIIDGQSGHNWKATTFPGGADAR